ncbi:glycerophosphodiester phosphodiesterase family protein [Periweissella ghanensis]|uniref:Glycerophosphodiester phosphodiesterase n=1 Tax=Periweissella ghanensis TaxID=467997 RepID=A0ABM8ZA52_9LACO|nr:glycerophosphodiester phosphodiesterase family protein [Periweissella ghanensis]MCM0599978.1 glycerophosphodiester phosphodiesterase [Periweissella ghanensis]CAH0418223.1 Glycerophosphodiester phosphodiesterase [Periweissella ghanensis]
MRTQIVAHRGDRKNAPENTLIAYQQALAFRELDVLEIDVHLTKDRQLVVIHDEKLERTTNQHGYVHEHTLAQLQAMDAGSWFDGQFASQHLPSLEDVLKLLRETNFNKTLLIEVKTDHIAYPDIELLLWQRMQKEAPQYQVVYQSFNLDTLQKLAALDQTLTLNALVFYPTLRVMKMYRQGIITAINPDNRWFINRLFWLKKAHVSPWTVNTERAMRAVFKAQLGRIITDDIALAVKLRKEIQD